MAGTTVTPKIKVKTKIERPRLPKVILVNDDFTPRCQRNSGAPK